jgi:hypothetical protein
MVYKLFGLYKFNILSLIEYNNSFFTENNVLINQFDYLTLNITKFDMDVFNEYELINQDYLKLNKYKDSIYDFYTKTNTKMSKDIILINLDNIMGDMMSIMELYSKKN